ncbi:LOW QUALITY PROTEIN: mitogen-activated protein kinase 15 [Thomomys bottae]
MSSAEVDRHVAQRYQLKRRLGRGAYGVVWKAVDRKTGEVVAIKKIVDAFRDRTDAQRTFREAMLLRALGVHPNITRLLEVLPAQNDRDIYLVLESMDTDLNAVIQKGGLLDDVHQRYILCQLLWTSEYLHAAGVIHRDQKPSNVLLDARCSVKLCDFGLARRLGAPGPEGPPLTQYVATRWYRAPEVLLHSSRYSPGVDMWSLGCILGEMLRGRPLFPGASTLHQLHLILEAVAPPAPEGAPSGSAGRPGVEAPGGGSGVEARGGGPRGGRLQGQRAQGRDGGGPPEGGCREAGPSAGPVGSRGRAGSGPGRPPPSPGPRARPAPDLSALGADDSVLALHNPRSRVGQGWHKRPAGACRGRSLGDSRPTPPSALPGPRIPWAPGGPGAEEERRGQGGRGSPPDRPHGEACAPGAGQGLERAGGFRRPRPSLEALLPADTPPDALDLLRRLLTFAPHRRLSASEALRHPYVRRFHCPERQWTCGADLRLPEPEGAGLSASEYRGLLYEALGLRRAARAPRPPRSPEQPPAPAPSLGRQPGRGLRGPKSHPAEARGAQGACVRETPPAPPSLVQQAEAQAANRVLVRSQAARGGGQVSAARGSPPPEAHSRRGRRLCSSGVSWGAQGAARAALGGGHSQAFGTVLRSALSHLPGSRAPPESPSDVPNKA